MLNKKAQTAIELLIVLGGILIIGILVVMILISTGSAKAEDISLTDSGHTQLLDKSVFPPIIENLKCSEIEGNRLNIELNIIESITKNIKDYCLVINGEITIFCTTPINNILYFSIDKGTNSYYSIGISSRSHSNTLSSSSTTLSCNIKGTGTITGSANFSCPLGYSRVPGSSLYNTNYTKGGFCVMTWEAKVDRNGDGDGDGVPSESTCQFFADARGGRSGVWLATRPGCRPSNHQIVSSANGFPLGDVNIQEARGYCSAQSRSGYSCSVINNDQWMTIARNLEQQPINWSSGQIGYGTLKTGNSASSGVNQIPQRNYHFSCGSWSSPPVTYQIHYANSGCMNDQRGANSLARLLLSSNDDVWDFSGNMLEFVDTVITASTEPIPLVLQNYVQGTPIEFTEINIALSTGFGPNQYLPSNRQWTSTQGVGRIGTRWLSGSIQHLLVRGGQFNGDSVAGIFSINFDVLTRQNTYLGFRCVCIPQ